jgi:selenocysteine lyase/cysteine desulfurase
MGPLSRAVQKAGMEALARRAVPTGITADDFFAPAEAARRACAQLVEADPERIALLPTVAYGIATAVRNLGIEAGRTVVIPGEQFPSNVYSWRALTEQGVKLRVVAAPTADEARAEGCSRAALWNRRLLDAITGDCAAVAVETVHWTDGTAFDLQAIGERARAVGAAFIIDGTQTVGARPLDVSTLQPDMLVVHSYKAMLCHYGLGFAYLGSRFDGGRPLEESWLMRRGAEDFSRLVDYQDDYAPGMRRYDSSLRANPVLVQSLLTSARELIAWQPARIAAWCHAITADFVGQARDMGFTVADEAERAANIFGLRAPEGLDLGALRSELAARRIYVSIRGSAIRISPHVYNDEGDLGRLAAALRACRG